MYCLVVSLFMTNCFLTCVSQIFILSPEQGYSTLSGTSAIALIRGPNKISGMARFYQQDNPQQPLIVDLTVQNLPEGDYVLRVHNYGDTTDGCKNAGKQWYELYRFTIDGNTTKNYQVSFRDRNVGLHDEFNIIGRALSVASAELGYDTDVALSCQPIGLAGEVLYRKSGSGVIIKNLGKVHEQAIWYWQDKK